MTQKDELISRMHSLLQQKISEVNKLREDNVGLVKDNQGLTIRVGTAEEKIRMLSREHLLRATDSAIMIEQERHRADDALDLATHLSSSLSRNHLLVHAEPIASMQMEDVRSAAVRSIVSVQNVRQRAFAPNQPV